MSVERFQQGTVAIVGGGAAGLSAAHRLQHDFQVTLFERAPRAGGHANTFEITRGADAGLPIDTGFIVFNNHNYPLFTRLLDELGVASIYSDMSFGYHCEMSGLQYAGTSLAGLFAQRRNLLRPAYWRFLREIVRFSGIARRRLAAGDIGSATLGEFLDAAGCSAAVRDYYVLPLAAAIWSGSRTEIEKFPAASLLRFFDNHGLLQMRDRPRWKTIVGGSRAYVRELLRRFDGQVHTDAAVEAIRRAGEGVTVQCADGTSRRFDRVVLAIHADQALRLLKDASAEERRLLGVWRYNHATAVLHTDASLMPPNRRAWASWNYLRPLAGAADTPIIVTYHMNRLQGLDGFNDYFVSLNPPHTIDGRNWHAEFHYAHPCYTGESVDSQEQIARLSGTRNTYFCGSYLGHGFHEDAVRSGFAAAEKLAGDAAKELESAA